MLFRSADLFVGETTCDGKKKAWEILAEDAPMYIMDIPQIVTVEQGVTDHDEDNAADSGSSADSVTINITDGDSTSSVAKKLADEGLIDDAKAFEKLMEKNKLQGFLVTGDHSIPKNTSNASIIKIITGKTIKK